MNFRFKGRRTPGYTLMELVVASMISLLVIAGLYVVYASQAKVFRGQEMVSQAQMSARFGIEVVKNDLKRAGFMATTDTDEFVVKQRLCETPAIGRIKAIDIVHNSGQVANATQNIGTTAIPTERPDQLTLVGNYTDTEAYWVDNINGINVQLQDNTTIDPTDPFPLSEAAFDETFKGDNTALARIRHQEKTFFSLIGTGSSYGSKTVAISNNASCLPGLWDGSQFNVINKIRYSVVNAILTQSEIDISGNRPGLQNRMDLVRDVLDWTDDSVVTRTVVAENVVDFQVWFLFDDTETPNTGPQVDQSGFMFPDNWTGSPPCQNCALGNNSTGMIRNIHGAQVRLSVRTHREDPNFPMPTGITRPLQWYEVDPASKGAARVRTIVTQVDMPNIGYSL